MKHFFENSNSVIILDKLAQRYGKLPHELLKNISVDDYNFNVAVMLGAEEYLKNNVPKKDTDWAKLGISRTVKRTGAKK